MSFVDKDTILNDCVNLNQRVNHTTSRDDDLKRRFNLANGLVDLKFDSDDTTKLSIKHSIIGNRSMVVEEMNENHNQNHNLLTNGQSSNQQIINQNNFNNHNQIVNCTNGNNLIAQSYELAKIANEFKEKLNDVYIAIAYYNKSIELNPYEGRFYVNRSICLQQANQLKDALVDANTAISLMPNHIKPYLRKAEIYQVMNKFNDAENILNYCLNLKTANDIPLNVVQDEIQKIIKTALAKCGISDSIIEQTNHCKSIEQAIDVAFSKQMEEKLKFGTTTTSTTATVERNYAIRPNSSTKPTPPPPTTTISKSLDSQETIDYLTDEELVNTPNRKLSINDDTIFSYNLQSPSIHHKDHSFSYNQIETTTNIKHHPNQIQLNNINKNLNNNNNDQNLLHYESSNHSSSLANHQNHHFIRQPTSSIGIPIMNRKRNSLCEPIEIGSGSFNNIRSLNLDRFSNSSHVFDSLSATSIDNRKIYAGDESIYSKSLGSNLCSLMNRSAKHDTMIVDVVDPNFKEAVERANICTNLIGYKGLWLGNVSSLCSRERLISIFRKYGDPIVHQLKQSPCVFIKYNNEKSPTEAIQDLHGKVLPDIVHNKNEPIRLHFECNRRQQEENFPKDKLPRKYSNGECYFWRTVGCSLGKACHKIHVPVNAGIDFQIWMLRDIHHQEAKNQLALF